MGLYIGGMRSVSTALAVAATATAYSNAFPIGYALYFGLWLKVAVASGTPDIKVELEESYILPVTEGAQDDNWIEPDGASDISASIGDALAHIFTISPKPMPFARFKLTGLNSNPSSATVALRVFLQEPR